MKSHHTRTEADATSVTFALLPKWRGQSERQTMLAHLVHCPAPPRTWSPLPLRHPQGFLWENKVFIDRTFRGKTRFLSPGLSVGKQGFYPQDFLWENKVFIDRTFCGKTRFLSTGLSVGKQGFYPQDFLWENKVFIHRTFCGKTRFLSTGLSVGKQGFYPQDFLWENKIFIDRIFCGKTITVYNQHKQLTQPSQANILHKKRFSLPTAPPSPSPST